MSDVTGPTSPPDGPLLDPYLRAAIAELEQLPQNQSGADKSHIEDLIEATRAHYRDAVRAR